MMKINSGQFQSYATLPKWYKAFLAIKTINYLEDHAFISVDQSAHLKIHLTQTKPGARPTKHISIEFEIRWKFKTL